MPTTAPAPLLAALRDPHASWPADCADEMQEIQRDIQKLRSDFDRLVSKRPDARKSYEKQLRWAEAHLLERAEAVLGGKQ